jgi:peroxiredoxin Q/BCP
MAQLRQDYEKFNTRDAEIVVVGPEDAEAFGAHWEKEKLTYPGLPDPKHSVLKLYGQEIKLFKLGRMPAQVIVDKQGQARYLHYGHSMRDIPTSDELLALLDDLNQETAQSLAALEE